MSLDQRRKRRGSQQRRVPGHYKQIFSAAADGFARDLHGMPSAALRMLHHRLRAKRLDGCGNLFGLMPHNDNNFSRLQRLASPHHMLHKRTPASPMQHLSHIGFQPRAFSGGQHQRNSVFRRHSRIILA